MPVIRTAASMRQIPKYSNGLKATENARPKSPPDRATAEAGALILATQVSPTGKRTESNMICNTNDRRVHTPACACPAALLATLLSIWLRIATAMSEIIVGTVAQLIIGAPLGASVLGTDQSWVRFLASTGAVILTFLAGAELDPQVMRREWKQATVVGLVAFAAPFWAAQLWLAT